jgi:hypothetical protein
MTRTRHAPSRMSTDRDRPDRAGARAARRSAVTA